jgi:hypothetical protein
MAVVLALALALRISEPNGRPEVKERELITIITNARNNVAVVVTVVVTRPCAKSLAPANAV